jgi:hypothetical protein
MSWTMNPAVIASCLLLAGAACSSARATSGNDGGASSQTKGCPTDCPPVGSNLDCDEDHPNMCACFDGGAAGTLPANCVGGTAFATDAGLVGFLCCE